MGYAKKNIFGTFNYTFETLKADDSVRTLKVGISTDSDLVLKNAEGEVEYRFDADTTFSNLETAGVAMAPQKSAAIDSYVSQIGYGKINKTASNLAALESYSVKGAYADSRWKLYAKKITIFVLVILTLLVVSGLVVRVVLRRLKKGKVTEGVVKSEGGEVPNKVTLGLIALGISFVSSLLTLFYSAFVYFIGTLIDDIVSYRYTSIFVIFLVIISFAVYAVLILAPGIYFGVKKGVGWGIATIVMTILWLGFYLILAVMFVFFFGSGRNSPIYPMLETMGVN